MWKVGTADKQIYKTLKPQGAAEPTLSIVELKHVDEGIKDQLVKIN